MSKSIILTPFFLALLLVPPGQSLAKVTGQCANCHTMHNSQNGSDLSGEPKGTLLVNNCVGCHSSGISSTTYSLGGCAVPVVNYTGGSAPSEHLAGGNFYWVSDGGGDDDAKGHNVYGIAGQDSEITAAEGAPGGNNTGCSTTQCHSTLAVEQTGNGTFESGGCQGCHLRVAHHADDSATVVGETGGYYRFLSGHMGGGVEGIEDSDWHASKGASDHNEYLGNVGNNKASMGGIMTLGNTMTGYCCGCHGNFHIENEAADGSGAWVRHPSDAIMPSSGEYASYTVYNPDVPVARPDLSGYSRPSTTVTPGTDLVMCLSCHRPHGSPYSDMLRWDYSLMSAGTTGAGAGNGCFVCHSNKDGI